MPADTDSTSQEPIYFRVAAIERFSPSARLKPGYLMLRVDFLNLDEPLRMASFALPPDQYQAHRASIDEALAFGTIYWVVRDAATIASFSLQDGETLVHLLLQAIVDKQILTEETEE